MPTLKIMTFALTAIALSVQVTTADDSVWRSSKPLRIRAVSATSQASSASAQSAWDRVEYPLLVQQLQAQIAQARANVEFWELRLENYEPLRFTDAIQSAIKHAENALSASRRFEADATRKLALVRRHRVALGQLRLLAGLLHHLEEDQKRQLGDVLVISNPIVAQHVAQIPQLADDVLSGCHISSVVCARQGAGKFVCVLAGCPLLQA